MSLALIVIDMQRAYRDEDPAVGPSMKRATEYILATHALFQKHGRPTFVVQDEDMPDGRANPGYANIPELTLDGAAGFVSKIHGNAFYDTELESKLRDAKVDFAVLAGFNAAFCMTATYFGAQERGFTAALLKGGIASHDPRHVAYAYEMRDTVSYPTLAWMLQA